MRVFALVLLVACGSVKDPPAGGDDAPPPGKDAPGTCAGDQVGACGASCTVCTATSDREDPTCNGTSCGTACKGGAPSCTDNSCSRVLWAFDSLMLDGITPVSPNNLQLAVRNHLGNPSLAIDLTSLTEVSFRIPICLSGTVDLQSKTLRFEVFFEGGDPTGEQYFVQASVPSPMPNAVLGQRGVQAGMFVPFAASVSMSQFAATATEATIQLGTFGAAFSGTIWVDSISFE